MRVRRVGRVTRERCRTCGRSIKLYASRSIVAATRERPDECELTSSFLLIIRPPFMRDPGTVIICRCEDGNAAGRISRRTDLWVAVEQTDGVEKVPVIAGIGTKTWFFAASAATECTRRPVVPAFAGIKNGLVHLKSGRVDDPELLRIYSLD